LKINTGFQLKDCWNDGSIWLICKIFFSFPESGNLYLLNRFLLKACGNEKRIVIPESAFSYPESSINYQTK